MLITMGCGVRRPVSGRFGLRRDDWPLEDSKGKPIEAVRAIRDEITGLFSRIWRFWVRNSGGERLAQPCLLTNSSANPLEGRVVVGLESSFRWWWSPPNRRSDRTANDPYGLAP